MGIYVRHDQAVGFPNQHGTRGNNTMARYNVLYFCIACRRIHPMGVSLPLEDNFLTMKTITDAYCGKPLPFHVAMLVGSSVTCRETGRSFVLEDTDKVYLAPVLEPSSRNSKRA
jgi:hypothetical protein